MRLLTVADYNPFSPDYKASDPDRVVEWLVSPMDVEIRLQEMTLMYIEPDDEDCYDIPVNYFTHRLAHMLGGCADLISTSKERKDVYEGFIKNTQVYFIVHRWIRAGQTSVTIKRGDQVEHIFFVTPSGSIRPPRYRACQLPSVCKLFDKNAFLYSDGQPLSSFNWLRCIYTRLAYYPDGSERCDYLDFDFDYAVNLLLELQRDSTQGNPTKIPRNVAEIISEFINTRLVWYNFN